MMNVAIIKKIMERKIERSETEHQKNYGPTSGTSVANEEWSDPYYIF